MKLRELRDLSLVLIAAIIFSMLSLSINFIDRLYNFFVTYTSLPAAKLFINLVFLYLAGLILLLYRRWLEAAKKQAELENIIASISPYVLVVADPDGNIVKCSTSLKRMFGYETDEVISRKTDLLYSELPSNPEHNSEILNILRREGFYVEYAEGKKKNGKTIPLEIITGNLRGRDGSVSLLRDITERKQVEEALIIKDRAIESSINGIGIADLQGYLTYVNKAFLKMWGYDEKEVLGKHILEFCQKEDEVTQVMEELQDEGWMGEIKARRKDGSLFDVSFSASMVKDKYDNPVCMMVSLLDITERRRAEKALKSSEANLRNMIEGSVDGILVTDRNGIIRFVNPSAEALFDRKEEELLGEIFGFPIVTSETTELNIPWKDKGTIVVEMRVVEMEWKGESACLLSLRDITERKRYEESLIKTTEELKRLDEIKSEFISTASHEVRTPLASVKNAVDLILSKKAGEITDTQEKFLSMAERNINRLSALIDDLLNISRIESGKMQLNYTEVDIKNIIENVINTFGSLAYKKSLALKMNLAPDLPPIYADASRLEQVLINLVSNAIKFTPDRGTIAVDVHPVEGVSDMSEGLGGFLELAVTDTGIGIPKEAMGHLFEKFYQVEASLSVKKQPGTGLGLAISKGLVEALGGKIQCKSKEGVGSAFSFTLPIIDLEKRVCYMLENELAKAKQHHLSLAVLIIKPEDFTQVKEVYGIKECERVLEIVKEKIEKKGLKFTDKINVSRYNGEIIVLIIMPDTSCGGAQAAQKRIKTYLTDLEIAVGGSNYSCSFVSGVATYPDDGSSAEELLDFAMERLEKKGQ